MLAREDYNDPSRNTHHFWFFDIVVGLASIG